MSIRIFNTALFLTIILCGFIMPQQINVPRIELMPKQPSPYIMRDWKQVARGYDSLVFNPDLSGQYLPLIRFYNNTVNYPAHGSFTLHTVVGTKYPEVGEAVNVLPAVIGATLSGIDKSSQNGKNFVLMCEEFFNNRAEENVYLNTPVTSSGNDWWYETMPNVFFYQLFDLYPGTGDFNKQFVKVADRWLEAVQAMGGGTTPWTIPGMNYRAWELSTMTPNKDGIIEPEAAGAIGWILYNAYIQTGEEKYRIGAEQSIEFLNSLTANPSYELQLGYGVLAAARMNAELGTNYNIEKLVNWCFEIGPLRTWGSIIGTWSGYDVSGLIGESIDNDYAFLMNTFELGGTLVPMVRYDTRFARAVGKWMLNAANAARLFYREYLPASNQDSYDWSLQYDPHSYIAHEALRESKNGKSPFSTGDAVSGNWGATNLALYGSSHVGIFGGIIDTTNVEKILRLDLRKTDYFNKSAFPSYLYYNPYESAQSVELYTGTGNYDIYDLITNTYIASGVSGKININIPADGVTAPVILPAGGTVTYKQNIMLVNGIPVDYNSGKSTSNNSPRVKSLSAAAAQVIKNDSVYIYCTAADIDGDPLSYSWQAEGGTISGSGNKILFKAPSAEGNVKIICTVSDGKGGTAADTIIVNVVSVINKPPVINWIKAIPGKIDLSAVSVITANVSDPDGDAVSYSFSSEYGSLTTLDNKTMWTAPSVPGNYYIRCTADDSKSTVTDSIAVAVRDFSQNQTGNLVLYLPFNGNANDESGNGNTATVSQAALTADRFNNSKSAYYFDGNNDYIQVKNSSLLNFQKSISLNFWIKVKSFFDREQYPVSHGNWENRWKVSVTDKKLRWTIKTSDGVKDLDSKTEVKPDSLYNVTVIYDGSDMEIYINGQLDAFTNMSGLINTTSYDLMFGQSLPGSISYGFNGVLDDVRLYDYALSVSEVEKLYDLSTEVSQDDNITPAGFYLAQNYPNPFNPETNFIFTLPAGGGHAVLRIYDVLGREVDTVLNENKPEGRYSVKYNASGLAAGIYYARLQYGENQKTIKMVYLK
jgi:hypothetical protein